jgi:hypothetical protein
MWAAVANKVPRARKWACTVGVWGRSGSTRGSGFVGKASKGGGDCGSGARESKCSDEVNTREVNTRALGVPWHAWRLRNASAGPAADVTAKAMGSFGGDRDALGKADDGRSNRGCWP